MPAIFNTELPIPLTYRGKVRDTYDLGDKMLLIATDRISAFDSVLPTGVPEKGLVLNQLSAFWFKKTEHIWPNHMIAEVTGLDTLKGYVKSISEFPDYIIGRSMIVHKAQRIPVEAVVRGYLSGSAWEEYKNKGTISGVPQKKGMQESENLSEPLFTPTTKADAGHDLPLSKTELEDLVGKETAKIVEEKSISVYEFARDYAVRQGIIIADTKFEFGFINGKIALIDELLTPDSSRFWDAKGYSIGKSQPSFDKQPVRDWLIASGWNKEPPAPQLPDEIVNQTTERYKQAFLRLVGKNIIK